MLRFIGRSPPTVHSASGGDAQRNHFVSGRKKDPVQGTFVGKFLDAMVPGIRHIDITVLSAAMSLANELSIPITFGCPMGKVSTITGEFLNAVVSVSAT